ncbi:hypothetical protein VC83_03526 [Pseudogymnoascus destructans]|uniref:Uncharacterized protein n=2 Tax=Pseudogymnoascus destructans TaxID=655981 RepID=L8G6A3_PSED2|nr:uncharacterized protein VC83_03526 [Pseudogymnoascus destructans]ELR08384.1 hypothetical protein GMDG_03173 [Pseudogymnoascus destructans 20631-21]OAF60332.2 hypothetical protein VC83_03526 [Pseudogymnoascus destructans]
MMAKAIRESCTPEPESLRHLLVTHPSTRLFVRPESWTAEHLAFLDCPPPQAITTPTEAISNRSRRYPPVKDQILHEFDTLDCVRVKSLRDESIRRLFSLLVLTVNQLRFSSPKLPLLYDSLHVATVSCPLLVCARETSRPMFAFIDNTWISRKRRKEFTRQKQPLNVAYKLVQKMNKLPFDPYNASILIAIAQSARLSIPDGDIQAFLFSPTTDRKSIIQYSATITSSYLRKFDEPYKSHTSPLIITEKYLSLNEPELIVDALHNIEQLARLPKSFTSPLKRKVMSDITNSVDMSVAEREPARKRVHIG